MIKLINKEKYIVELKKIISEIYPDGNYTKYILLKHDNKVRIAMDKYVLENYSTHNIFEHIKLINEKNYLYKECVQNYI